MGCPVCGKEYSLFNRASDVYWEIQGGGQAVCKRCKKNRMPEIEKHNAPYRRRQGDLKDKNCKHDWVSANLTMWSCSKCSAVYRLMCGCGGSEYVCEKHHKSHQEYMIKEEGSVKAYLDKHSW